MSKITFSKSDPYHQGWQGWSDRIDVFLDGKKVGQVAALRCSQKRWMEYNVFDCGIPGACEAYSVSGFGIRAAKAACIEAITAALQAKP